MSKEEEPSSLLKRIRQFLQIEPQNKEELLHLLDEARSRELIDEATFSMLEGVIEFAQMRVRDIMLPKKQMVSVSIHDSLQQIIEVVTSSGHSRFPVTSEYKDNIIGIVHAKDVLRFQVDPSLHFDLKNILRSVTFVPESKRLDVLLKEFRHKRNHMAIVVDEYGLVSGFVTIEDVIEQIVGDIEDEFDLDEEVYIKAQGEDSYIIRGDTPIEIFNEDLDSQFSDDFYDTIGGIVMANFGYLPQKGESIIIDNMEFKVLQADARRINLLSCFDKR